jgi:hemerythrin-like metal-binding protein
MQTLEWSDALSLDLPLMDETHREFVDYLAAVESSDDSTVLQAWQTLITHTAEHFALEDRWMRETRFSSSNCHSMQHKVVLQVMQEGAEHGSKGDLGMVRQMARELGMWFPNHAQSMDAALALHLRAVGYDPLTGTVHSPDALPASEIHGCGSERCTDKADAPEAVSAEESA